MSETTTDAIEEIIGSAPGKKIARRTLEEIAVTGGYTAKDFDKGFIVYYRELDGITEEITIKEINQRRFDIIKITRTISK